MIKDSRIKKEVLLSRLSTFKIGGKAQYFVLVRNPDNLIKAVKWARNRKIPWRVFAGGSNVVFSDKGVSGLTIRFFGGRILKASNRTILADAGIPLRKIVEKSISLGWQGLETLSGIPGTLGGATVGNAGAYGHSISEVIKRVEVWDPGDGMEGRRKWIKKEDCDFAYRESIFKHKPCLVLRVEMGFKRGNRKTLQEISRKIIGIRRRKYKPGLRCPGSFFKNILVKEISRKSAKLIDPSKIIEGKIPTGYLLEEVRAKGMRSGGIEIADFHGNLFFNRGDGTAGDVKRLAKALKKKVKDRFGIELKEEIRYFG